GLEHFASLETWQDYQRPRRNSLHLTLPSRSLFSPREAEQAAKMGFNLHADGTNDPKEVRNWRIHMIAVIASMSAIAS
ncbi:hypothetical protein CTA1_4534, partial [Colletotrichum tanaceti]